jgi:hypothetical protein
MYYSEAFFKLPMTIIPASSDVADFMSKPDMFGYFKDVPAEDMDFRIVLNVDGKHLNAVYVVFVGSVYHGNVAFLFGYMTATELSKYVNRSYADNYFKQLGYKQEADLTSLVYSKTNGLYVEKIVFDLIRREYYSCMYKTEGHFRPQLYMRVREDLHRVISLKMKELNWEV